MPIVFFEGCSSEEVRKAEPYASFLSSMENIYVDEQIKIPLDIKELSMFDVPNFCENPQAMLLFAKCSNREIAARLKFSCEFDEYEAGDYYERKCEILTSVKKLLAFPKSIKRHDISVEFDTCFNMNIDALLEDDLSNVEIQEAGCSMISLLLALWSMEG